MIAIARPYDGITVNEQVEYVLDDNGNIMEFESIEVAKNFLRRHDVNENIIEDLIYEER